MDTEARALVTPERSARVIAAVALVATASERTEEAASKCAAAAKSLADTKKAIIKMEEEEERRREEEERRRTKFEEEKDRMMTQQNARAIVADAEATASTEAAAALAAAKKEEADAIEEEKRISSSVRVSSNDDRVISDLENNFQLMFEVRGVFVSNLRRELSSGIKKKLAIMFVDMDQVRNFDQDPRDVETILKLPMPVFVVGSAKRNVDSSVLASKGNFHFHFTRAQKESNSADMVLTMAATALQSLAVAYGRQEDVYFHTISNDKCFETVTQLLRNAGALSESISREVVAGGLDGIPCMLLDPSTSKPQETEMRTGFNWSQKEFVRG